MIFSLFIRQADAGLSCMIKNAIWGVKIKKEFYYVRRWGCSNFSNERQWGGVKGKRNEESKPKQQNVFYISSLRTDTR